MGIHRTVAFKGTYFVILYGNLLRLIPEFAPPFSRKVAQSNGSTTVSTIILRGLVPAVSPRIVLYHMTGCFTRRGGAQGGEACVHGLCVHRVYHTRPSRSGTMAWRGLRMEKNWPKNRAVRGYGRGVRAEVGPATFDPLGNLAGPEGLLLENPLGPTRPEMLRNLPQ